MPPPSPRIICHHAGMIYPVLLFASIFFTSNIQAAAVDEALFIDLGEKVVSLYQKELDKKGWFLDPMPEYSESSDQAVMKTRNAPFYSIYYTGGLVKKRKLSSDALSVILCHEAGHLFGKRINGDESPLSTAPEGEADYFATNDCLPKLWKQYPSLQASSSISANDMKALSARISLDQKNPKYKIVLRVAAASLEVLRKMHKLPALTFTDRDQTTVRSTLVDYPSVQCRLESYIAGVVGEPRPKCWFK